MYIYTSSEDTVSAVSSNIYFNNRDDAINLDTDDIIFCLATDGGVFLKVTAVFNGAVLTSAINLEDNLALAKSAFGETVTVEPEPRVALRFNYGLNTRLYRDVSANSGTFTVSDRLASVQSGTNSAGLGAMHSHNTIAYVPGLGVRSRYTAMFTTGVANSSQAAGLADAVDGFGFGYDGVTFGVFRLKDSVFDWIAQADWNEDVMDGTGPSTMTLDPTKLNVYQVQFQWLGAGQIRFSLEDDDTGEYVHVHRIKYTNRNVTPSIGDPTLPLSLRATNSGNTTNLTIKSSSMGAFTEGSHELPGLSTAVDIDNVTYLTVNGEQPILSVRVRTTYQSEINKITVRALSLGLSTDGTKSVIFRFYRETIIVGASFVDIDTTNSVLERDVSATSLTSGEKIVTENLAKVDAGSFGINDNEEQIHPGDIITVTAESSANSTVGVSIILREIF